MPCSSIDFNDLRLVTPELIELEPECFERAAQLSDRVIGESYQWQTYLNALGLQGFVQWLGDQDSSIVIDQSHCSIFQPQYANAIEAVCNLRIGEFTLCLMAVENVLDEIITIPRAAIDLPDFAAHFYVVVEVQEEQGQVMIRGYSRYDQLVSYRQLVNLSADNRWNYSFPLFLFDTDLNHLLLNLHFLTAATMPLPVAIAQVTPPASPVISRSELNTVLSHLHTPEPRLWQILSWEKGAALLQNPELLNALYQWQQSPEKPASLHIRITEVFTLATQQAINTAQWLRDELWYSSRMIAAGAPEFRSADRFRIAIEELRYQGMDIPAELCPMFQTIECEGNLLQLCAASWASVTSPPDWTLLLILRNQIGTALPDGLKLRVADLTGSLQEEEDALDTELLYVKADARQGSKLAATIVSPTGQVLPLTPYSFN